MFLQFIRHKYQTGFKDMLFTSLKFKNFGTKQLKISKDW